MSRRRRDGARGSRRREKRGERGEGEKETHRISRPIPQVEDREVGRRTREEMTCFVESLIVGLCETHSLFRSFPGSFYIIAPAQQYATTIFKISIRTSVLEAVDFENASASKFFFKKKKKIRFCFPFQNFLKKNCFCFRFQNSKKKIRFRFCFHLKFFF